MFYDSTETACSSTNLMQAAGKHQNAGKEAFFSKEVQAFFGEIEKPAYFFRKDFILAAVPIDMMAAVTAIIKADEVKIMLHIVITCGAGFSSSALVTQLNKDAQEKNLDVEYRYMPFDFGGLSKGAELSNADIVMLCPHLQHEGKKLAANYPDVPFYVIPTRLYGLMSAEDFMQDAEDAIAGWKETGMNPFHFEGESVSIRVMRTVSHRKWLEQKKK